MTYQDVLNSATLAVCESTRAADGIADYTERAPYLLASFVTHYADTDRLYRKAHGLPAVGIPTDSILVSLSDVFALSDVFVPAAVSYLASQLTIDENEEMSDRFFDRYINMILSIKQELPCLCESTVDRYGLI
jgi:hypothetical protein